MRTYTRKRPDYQFIENAHELCRLCLCKGDGGSPIFPDDANNVCSVLALRIMICVGLEMRREECLPNLICAECLNNLDKYYAFRKKCEASYQRLKSHVLAVKQRQCKLKLEQENEAKKKLKTESDDEMKFVVTFEKDQPADVSALNLNGVATKIGDISKADSIESNTVMIKGSEEEPQDTSQDTQEPDITTFLSTMLLELGLLTHTDSGLVFSEQSIGTLELETGDGSQVMLELVEEDDEPEIGMEENIVTEQPMEPLQQTPLSEQNVVIKYVTTDSISQNPSSKKKNNNSEIKKTGAWCDECNKAFASRSALNRHRRIHSGEKPYRCPHCARGFTQREVMLRHSFIHEEVRPHVCEVCAKSFTQRGGLAAHRRQHAPAHKRPLTLHTCSRCPKVFLYASGLSRHMMMHQGRVYVCGACDRQFKDKSSLMRHLKNANHTVTDKPTT